MIINYLKVYTPPSPKVRYGINQDGGYVGVKTSTDILLSGGIGTDISFELDFVKMNDVNAVCADSIFYNGNARFIDLEDFVNNSQFKNDPYISKLQFVNKFVGKDENDKSTNYHNFLKQFSDITLKLDIEGGEFDYINSLSNKQLNKINQIFLEVHWLDKLNDFSFFEKLNQNHILIHAHGNNNGRVFRVGKSRIPKVLEVTYLHKKFFSGEYKLNSEPLPSSIDFPNRIKRADLSLNFPPFVNFKKMKIPKIIHQTWVFKNDDYIKGLRDKWLGYNPEYEYFIYNNKDNLKFIKENFNERIYNCYSRILNGSAKADFFRYAVLYIKGGVYLDIDFLPKASLSDCIEENDELIITHDDQVRRRHANPNGVFNAFICAKPKHELLLILINQICEYIENGEHNNVRHAIHSLTGSKLFSEKFRNYFKTQNIKECKTDSYKIVTHHAFTPTPHNNTITCGDKILFTSQNSIPNRSLIPHYNSNFELYR